MLRSSLLVALAATTLAAIAVGCGPDTTNTTSTSSSSSSGNPLHPPDPPAGGAACKDVMNTQAINELFLGDTNRDGTPNASSGWKSYGYDLDGFISKKESTNLCSPQMGGSAATIYPDGNDGIDNSFGKNILPIIISLAMDISATANNSIKKGDFTVMLDFSKLGTDCTGSAAQLYAGGKLLDANMMPMAPKFDGTDVWPVTDSLLVDPMDITKGSTIKFNEAYVAGDTWVSGTKGTVSLQLTISGYTISLDITNAYVTLDLAGDQTSGTNGTIAGILDTEQLVSQISKVAAAFDQSFCDPTSPTLVSVLNQLRQASDIGKDGKQVVGKMCDGISIGIGFNTKAVKLGGIAPKAAAPPDPCGTGGGGGAGGGP